MGLWRYPHLIALGVVGRNTFDGHGLRVLAKKERLSTDESDETGICARMLRLEYGRRRESGEGDTKKESSGLSFGIMLIILYVSVISLFIG